MHTRSETRVLVASEPFERVHSFIRPVGQVPYPTGNEEEGKRHVHKERQEVALQGIQLFARSRGSIHRADSASFLRGNPAGASASLALSPPHCFPSFRPSSCTVGSIIAAAPTRFWRYQETTPPGLTVRIGSGDGALWKGWKRSDDFFAGARRVTLVEVERPTLKERNEGVIVTAGRPRVGDGEMAAARAGECKEGVAASAALASGREARTFPRQ